MNERIRELANELGPIATIGNWGRVEWKDNVYPQLGDKLYAAIDLQKFALLIVRECIARVEGCAVEFDDNHPNDQFIAGYNKGVSKTASQVKQHFGVAE